MKLNTKVTSDVVGNVAELCEAADEALVAFSTALEELQKYAAPTDLREEWKALQNAIKEAKDPLINTQNVIMNLQSDLDNLYSDMDDEEEEN